MLAGISVLSHGVATVNAAHAIGGGCLSIIALMAASMVLLRSWIMDTANERRVLAAAQQSAAAERSRYFAAQAALENEMGRLNRDIAEERRRIAAQLLAEREAMQQEFEERRATLISETMEATVLMFRAGKFDPDQSLHGKLIQFPEKLQKRVLYSQEQSRGRDQREHGVAGD